MVKATRHSWSAPAWAGGGVHGLYLVKAAEGHAAYHDRGVQSDPGEEAGTLQGYVCQSS